jgi:hypothetical protein
MSGVFQWLIRSYAKNAIEPLDVHANQWNAHSITPLVTTCELMDVHAT